MEEKDRYVKDDWDARFSLWKREQEKKLKQTDLARVFNRPLVTPLKEDKIESIPKLTPLKEPVQSKPAKLNIFVKILIVLIPILIGLFIIYANFFQDQDFEYFYDIGEGKENYLTPLSRVSGQINDSFVNYRNITDGLIYISVPYPRNAKSIHIETRFKDNFPLNGELRIGVKDREEWHYDWESIYFSTLTNISSFEINPGIFRLNSSLPNLSLAGLSSQKGIVIASNNEVLQGETKISNFSQSWYTIDSALRGGHVFYVYVKDSLNLSIHKQDLNWYDGEDVLDIQVFDSSNQLIANFSIPDDGVTKAQKGETKVQTAQIIIPNIKEGVYRIDFKDFDGLIRQISLNTNKVVVANQLYLANSRIFNEELEKNTTIYTYLSRPSQISFKTWHDVALQDIMITNFSSNYIVPLRYRVNETFFNASVGFYSITSEKNDIIVFMPGYFSFSKDSYFEPFINKIIPIKNDLSWLKTNADYIVTNYQAPKKDNGWLIASLDFDSSQVYAKDNMLSIAYNIPHLSQDAYKSYTIPLDWIKIKIYKQGIFSSSGA